jgi:ribosome assembly protein 1
MQNDPEMLRNICILAHVDHGKTTLSDSLIASNQIISTKMAGKLRMMDSREDEQQRQITMKASSITLFHQTVQRISKEKKDEGVVPKSKLYKINLMDSPGHVDFTNEVSSALRLSDGALVLIDCVEGVSPQSLTVLRQAWDEKVRTCLVLNKMDKLIIERNMDAEDIFQHTQNIIEQVNAIISSFINETNMQNYIKSKKNDVEGSESSSDEGKIENDEKRFFYSPEKGNVAFTSAFDGWGFTLPSFSYLIAKKLNMTPKRLCNYLWGDFYLNNGKITKKAPTKNSKPIVVQYVFQQVVSAYKKVLDKIDVNDLNYVNEYAEVSEMLKKRLPIDKSIFEMVVNKLPSPVFQQKERLEVFCPELANLPNDIIHKPLDMTEEEYKICKNLKESIEN